MSITRRYFLRTAAASSFFLGTGPGAWCAEPANNPVSDDEILSQCKARIEQHRKSDGSVLLRDPSRKPVSNATIRLEQQRHDFLFGCNFFMFNRTGDPDREEKYRAQFAALLNFATLGFYWANYEFQRGQPNYDYTDQAVEWCAQQGITCKGHPLVWDHPAGSPRWLPEDGREIERLSTTRVRDLVTRYQGRIDIWDVVNEATHLPEDKNNTRLAGWGKSLGPVDYLEKHLRVAREANPPATLLVNDYRTDTPFFNLLERLRARSRSLFDVVGIQSHMHGGVWPLRKVWDVCDTYAKLNLPIHFTETTILSGSRAGRADGLGPTTPEVEERQAEWTANFYAALFAHPAVQAVTWWDFSDLGAWQRAPAGWLRRDMSPKPVYDRIKSLLRGEWWTKLEGGPDASGVLAARAFHGRHRVTVELPNGRKVTEEIHWQPGKENKFEIEIS